MSSRYFRILQSLPRGYTLAFAYGSGVFKQIGHKNVKDNMMDFILAVRDPPAWHKANLALNPRHYSGLRRLGPDVIASIQDNYGAKVYFNTLVPTHEGMIKYGVISHNNLIADLLDWETLYVAGRLHKPVLMLHQEEDEELRQALKVNLFAAMHTALLLLPETFSEEQLYLALAGISYTGDFRMHVGEDQQKVKNIVRGQMGELRQLYGGVLGELEEYVLVDHSRVMVDQDTSPPARLYHLSMLPKTLQLLLLREWNKDRRNRDLEDVLRAAAHDTDTEDVIAKGIQDIVKVPTMTQSVKGIITAGGIKTLRYSWAKLRKMWKSLRR